MADMDVPLAMWTQVTSYEQFELQIQRVEMIREATSLIYTLLAMYLSIISANLVTAYTAGKTLTRPQVSIATITYFFGAVIMVTAAGVYISILNFDSTERALAEIDRSWPSNQKLGAIDIPVILTLLTTYIGSLLFAFTSRGRQTSLA